MKGLISLGCGVGGGGGGGGGYGCEFPQATLIM